MKTETTRVQSVGRDIHADKRYFFSYLAPHDLSELKEIGTVRSFFREVLQPDNKTYRPLAWNIVFSETERWMNILKYFDGDTTRTKRYFLPVINEEQVILKKDCRGGTVDQVFRMLDDSGYLCAETKTGRFYPFVMSSYRREMAFEQELLNLARDQVPWVKERLPKPVTHVSMWSAFNEDSWMEKLTKRTFTALKNAIFRYHVTNATAVFPKLYPPGFCQNICGHQRVCVNDTRNANELPLGKLGLIMRDDSRRILERDYSKMLNEKEISW